jgi:hypothetical protein
MFHGARTVALQVHEVDGHASRKEAAANSTFVPQSLLFSKSLLTMLSVARLRDDELGLSLRIPCPHIPKNAATIQSLTQITDLKIFEVVVYKQDSELY